MLNGHLWPDALALLHAAVAGGIRARASGHKWPSYMKASHTGYSLGPAAADRVLMFLIVDKMGI